MTKRKPPGVTHGDWIEAHVRKAERDGLFDDLPGAGKPLRDLAAADDPFWWAKKLIAREKLSVLPPALEIRSKVEKTLAGLPALKREAEVREALQALNAEIGRLNAGAHQGPPTHQPLLDIEARVAEWRRARRV